MKVLTFTVINIFFSESSNITEENKEQGQPIMFGIFEDIGFVKKQNCQFCIETFVSEYDKSEHEKDHKREKQDKLTCSLCKNTYNSIENLNYHACPVLQNIVLKCTIYGENFEKNTKFKEHLKQHNGNGKFLLDEDSISALIKDLSVR